MKVKEAIKYLKARKKWCLLPVLVLLIIVSKFVKLGEGKK